MRVDMKQSRAYRKLLDISEKYPDEDISDILSAIIAHTMIYMTIMESTPLTRERDFEAIKDFYTPSPSGLQPNNSMIKSVSLLNKSIPVEVETIESKKRI